MKVDVDLSSLKKSSWRDYAIRCGFGGLITVIAGILTKVYGPAVGGLFLGFPAILPASLTLVKKHEGEDAAGDDALGAVAGSIGLAVFAVIVWAFAARAAAWQTLIAAGVVWLGASIAVWWIIRRMR